jgi:transposase
MQNALYIGLDVHKVSISVSVAEDGRDGPVRFIGEIPNTPLDVAKLAKRLAINGATLHFCYEAGCCGYGIYRQITLLGHACMVVAPSRIPQKPADRIKNDRRDAQRLAILHRSGDLTAVWVPDAAHEAMRDLVRARTDAARQLTCARHQLLAFLLRHGRSYESNRDNWTKRHQQWLARQTFDLPAHQIVFQDYVEAVLTTQQRRDQLVKRINELLPSWSMSPVVEALRGLRGMDTLSAVTFAAIVGDLSRFDTPRKLMCYLGLVPSEYSSGERITRGSITKTGSSEARRTLIEAAWSYRYPARVALEKSAILAALPKTIRDTAWKAQERLCARYRRLLAKGKKSTVAATAIARELAGFIWAIGQEVKPAMS